MEANNGITREIHELEAGVRLQLQSYITINSVAGAVSELLQNSIDAGAGRVTAKVDFSTLSVLVRDDGGGIGPESLSKVGRRHFTSKLALLTELERLKTFGFRGEALSSLATVGEVAIVSNTGGATWRIEIGKQPEMVEEGLSLNHGGLLLVLPFTGTGTEVTVLNMFHSIPVRRNQLLKVVPSKALEEIRLEVLKCLLKHPQVAVEILEVENGQEKQVLFVPKRTSGPEVSLMAHLLRSVYGSSLLPSYEKVSARFLDYELEGIVGTLPSQSRAYQFIFMNGRYLGMSDSDNRSINKIFMGSNFGSTARLSPTELKSRLFHQYPVFCINISCPVEIGDLLQDPSKSIIHSSQWQVAFKMTAKVFTSFLNKQGYDIHSPSPSPKKPKLTPEPKPKDCGSVLQIERESLQDCRVVKQLDNKFILVVVKNTKLNQLMIIDQHACHERITVEELITEFLNTRDRVPINPALTLKVSTQERELLQEFRSSFAYFGIDYDIGPVDGTVTALPPALVRTLGPSLRLGILQHAYDLHLQKKPRFPGTTWYSQVSALPSLLLDAINSRACRTSIKFGDSLSADEMDHLVRQLSRCHQPFQCAHGRPSVAPLVDLCRSDVFRENQCFFT